MDFDFPDVGDSGWGQAVTDWAGAVSDSTLQTTGGSFFLTAEVDFGPTAGLKALYYKSRTASVATAGQVRLANTDTINWRNAANTGNLSLGVNTDNVLTYQGTPIEGTFKAIIGEDGITVTSGTNTVTLTGFRTEFVSASGYLQDQISDNTPASYTHTQGSASNTWTITHNLGTLYPSVQVYDTSNAIIGYDDAYAVNANTFVIEFSIALAGTAVLLATGGGVPISLVSSVNGLTGALTIAGTGGISVAATSSTVVTVTGFHTEFVSASGSLQSQIDAFTVGNVPNAIVGSDGITVTSGSNTTDVAGFRTEFVNASGSLQTQIDGKLSAVVDDLAPQLGGDLDLNNHDIISSPGQNINILSGNNALVQSSAGITTISGNTALYLMAPNSSGPTVILSSATVSGSPVVTSASTQHPSMNFITSLTASGSPVLTSIPSTISITNLSVSNSATVSGIPVVTQITPSVNKTYEFTGGTAATIDIPLDTNYSSYEIYLQEVSSTSDNVAFWCRVTCNGTDYLASNGDYRYFVNAVNMNDGSGVSENYGGATADAMSLVSNINNNRMGTGTAEKANLAIKVLNRGSTVARAMFSWTGTYVNNSANPQSVLGYGQFATIASGSVVGLRFYMNSGNITCSGIKVFGYR